jgi:antitoxin component of MazEF toxin-antitoxin module
MSTRTLTIGNSQGIRVPKPLLELTLSGRSLIVTSARATVLGTLGEPFVS